MVSLILESLKGHEINLILISLVIATPIDFEPIAPSFDAQRDVRFLLNTRANRGTPQQLIWNDLLSLRNSNYDNTKPTR